MSIQSPKRRLRVLQLFLDLEAGGLERIVGDLARFHSPDRVELHLLPLLGLGPEAAGLEEHATLHDPPRMGRLSMLYPAALIRAIRAIAPDVVHSHSGVWHKASLAARRAGVPRVIHTDHGRPQLQEPARVYMLDRLACARTDVVVAVSAALEQDLHTRIRLPPQKTLVIQNGVDTDRFAPGPRGGAFSGPVIGTTGRFDPIKGHEVMIRAFALLRHRLGPGLRPTLLIVGEGPERSNLEMLIRSLGLDEYVRLDGWTKQVESVYRQLDIFTLSSFSEGTSISLLEAMSSGVCPVITDVGGNRATVGPDLEHRLVPAGSDEALARAWQETLESPGDRQRDAATGRRRVEALFSVRRMVHEYEQLYGMERATVPGGGTS